MYISICCQCAHENEWRVYISNISSTRADEVYIDGLVQDCSIPSALAVHVTIPTVSQCNYADLGILGYFGV